ncbi:MAG: UvrD-helicase domain-containing protein, partial [Nanoarchaeota archaeon]|nr:UvrD-helicase domain-containing protein [Nanoarchaeota archaeon]
MKEIHIPILKSFDELKFNLGKKTLIEFLKGNPNPTIERNNLDELNSYGCLFKTDIETIEIIINQLIKEEFLKTEMIKGGFTVINRTTKGIREIIEKKFIPKENSSNIKKVEIFSQETIISEKDKKLFQIFKFFLEKYNDEQKKAIISDEKNILSIAGAGSGKTTILTKRIEFLCKFKSINQKEILAITFTKKAKEEMKKRLDELKLFNIHVETFNSFCEKKLKEKGKLIYDKKVKVIQYKDKIQLVNFALNKLKFTLESISENYFNKKQLKEKSKEELFFIFVNDIFSIIDYFKNKEKNIDNFYEKEKNLMKRNIAKKIKEICQIIENEMKTRGIRDFSDQILDALKLFEKYPNEIPKFKHILIDEFQDVNKPQFKLIKLLNAENLFAVGDPRQAIFGWRGSDIKYILNFPKNFENSQIINLKQNYRSYPQIVNIFNQVIKPMGLINLIASKKEKNTENNNEKKEKQRVFLIEQNNENQEKIFILEAIKNSKNPRNEIFILARTNRILENYAEYLKKHKIQYTIKSEEEYKNSEPKKDEIVLATVHSIKGMEAKEVYLVSANSLSFPNKVSDNFIFSLVKENNSQNEKESEELRLFYVALSRAKEKLIISYTGNFSKFITKEIVSIIDI